MASPMTDQKKPMSLNERNQSILRGLSAQSRPSRPPPPTSSSNPTEEEQEEEKPHKVKLQGRRRLCKLSATDQNDEAENRFALDEPNFGHITDFDDSPPEKIRDILDDLTYKLDLMSIEKKKNKVDKMVEPVTQLRNVEKEDVLDYASAGSSLCDSPLERLEETFEEVSKSRIKVEGSENEGHKVFDTKIVVKQDKDSSGFGKYVKKEPVLVSDEDENEVCEILSSAETINRARGHGSQGREDDGGFISEDNSSSGLVSEDDNGSIVMIGNTSTYKLSARVSKMLYPHQRQGLKWLWSLHCKGTGGILGDDMGLGKTMQICGFLAGLFDSHLIKRVLVVAPKTLLAHWTKELSAVGLSEKTREYYGTSLKAREYDLRFIFQDSGILLTTYDIVRTSSKSLRGDFYFRDVKSEDAIVWDYIILDEGHIIKNPSTQRAKSLLEIPSAHCIIISGTPIQNNLKELWALFSFCCPELLGDKHEFKLKYEVAILRGTEKNATDREKRIGSSVAKELRERIQPYFLRRLKSEVFSENEAAESVKLSKKNELIVWLRLTTAQRQLYEAFLKSELALSSFDGSPLAALAVLKKICDHPFLLTKRAAEDVLEGMESMLNQEDLGAVERMASDLAKSGISEASQKVANDVSCKLTFISSLLGKLVPEGHNVLIFSQTRKMLNLVQETIISKGYKFLRIDGTTKISDREKIVKDFQEGEVAPIFLLTSQVGGLGLTLTKADRVIVVDPAWNPSTDNQSVDRAYRIGQKKDVIVYRLMTCGTIEEKIYKMQVFKGGLFKTATEHKEQTRYFSQKDLREVFRLPDEGGFDVSLTQQQMHEEHDQQLIMDATLKKHIEFLESQGIAGVSHHSLLYSKTAAVPVAQEDDEVLRRRETTYVGHSYSSSLPERSVNGAEYAFNPKDVILQKKNISPLNSDKLTESAIRERIERLRQTYENKAMLSRLPDKGEKIGKQIVELNLELQKLKKGKKSEVVEVEDLDDITGKLKNVLYV